MNEFIYEVNVINPILTIYKQAATYPMVFTVV